jgi:uncharacterized membrane protein YkvA (DUF1232 family)
MKTPIKTTIDKWKGKAEFLKTETYAIYLVYRHPQTPWYTKVLAGLVAAYAFSPIDLIPDFIPVFGYLDDLILVPLGIWLTFKMIPPAVVDECREKALIQLEGGKPVNIPMAVVIVIVWLGLGLSFVLWLVKHLG